MLNTGYISFITETGGGFDTNRNPIPASKVNSNYFPCNLKIVKRAYLLLVDGQQMQAKYTMIIDCFEISTLNLDNLTEVQLQDSENNDLGVFQVITKDFFFFTSKLKIVV